MRTILMILAALPLVALAQSPAPAPDAGPASGAVVDARKVLILATQGISPERDTVGFNSLVKNVTGAFSAQFATLLVQHQYHPVTLIDQQVGANFEQKTAFYAVKNAATLLALPSIETKTVAGDTQIQLLVQYVEADLMPSPSAPTSLRARTTIQKSYVLRGSKSGDSKMTMADIAADYLAFLQAAGRLQVQVAAPSPVQ
jgi:hypothetical protein